MGRLGAGCRWLLPRLKYGNGVEVSLLPDPLSTYGGGQKFEILKAGYLNHPEGGEVFCLPLCIKQCHVVRSHRPYKCHERDFGSIGFTVKH